MRRSRRIVWAVAIVVLVIVIASVASSHSAPATRAQKLSSFKSFESSISDGLGECNAAAEDVQIDLGLFLQKQSDSNLVTVDTAAKQAQGPCDDTQDNTLLTMETESVPSSISGYSGISNAPTDAGTWASDVGHVLHDIQNLAESSGSAVGDESQLQTDIQTADSQQQTIASDLQGAASALHTSFNLGLTKFG
jgi:hypothetical protein